jgi:hypothetical protein
MWALTRYRGMQRDPLDPRHQRMHELLHDRDMEAWITQTLGAFQHFGLCLKEQRERVLLYASRFYAGRDEGAES